MIYKILMLIYIACVVCACQSVQQKQTMLDYDADGNIVRKTETQMTREGAIDWSEGINKTLLNLEFLNAKGF